jgi:hypothetical protein
MLSFFEWLERRKTINEIQFPWSKQPQGQQPQGQQPQGQQPQGQQPQGQQPQGQQPQGQQPESLSQENQRLKQQADQQADSFLQTNWPEFKKTISSILSKDTNSINYGGVADDGDLNGITTFIQESDPNSIGNYSFGYAIRAKLVDFFKNEPQVGQQLNDIAVKLQSHKRGKESSAAIFSFLRYFGID